MTPTQPPPTAGVAGWRRPSPALAALVAGLGAVVAAGVHDYLFLHGRLPVTGMYWIPLVVPLGCVSFALVLIHRLVRALAVSEELTLTLEARVAERTLALQAADAAKTRFLAAASHDLRQPVAAIGLLVGLARERTPEPALGAMLDRVQQAVQALEALALLCGLRVVESNPSWLCIDRGSPCFAGFDAQALLPQTDLGLLLDVDVPWLPGGAQPREDSRWLHIDVDPV